MQVGTLEDPAIGEATATVDAERSHPESSSSAVAGGDVRHEREAAILLLLRMILLGMVRVASLLAVDVLALFGAAAVLGVVDGTLGGAASTPAVFGKAIVAFAVIMGLAAAGTYGPGDVRRDPWRIARGLLGGGLGALGFTLLFPQATGIGGTAVVLLVAMALVAVITARFLVDRLSRSISLRGYLRRRVLVVGDARSRDIVLQHFNGALSARLRVQGRLAVSAADDPTADGDIDDLEQFLERNRVDVVLITRTLPERQLQRVVTTAFRRAVRVEIVPAVVRDLDWHARPRLLFGCPVLEIRPSKLGVPQMALKRAFDISLAALALTVLSPLITLIAVAIKLDSRGPVFFSQQRAGLGGQPFTIWKFRTMVAEADTLKRDLVHLNESGDPRLFKIEGDPRVTRVGALLRRLSLDEIPQLFNVLRGDMSFVGPRPFFPEDLEHYEPHHFERLSVLPGITGQWQVSGRSDIREFEQVVELDQQYIREWSLLLDFRILLKTIPAVFRRNGAF